MTLLALAVAGQMALDEPRPALADASAPFRRGPVPYSYEIETPDALPETLFVNYPSRCGSDGGPLWVGPSAEESIRKVPSYEVMTSSYRATVRQDCQPIAAIYALPASRFTAVFHPGRPASLATIGTRDDQSHTTLTQLDTCPDRKSCEALLRAPGGQKLAHRFVPVHQPDLGTSLTKAHEVLSVRRRPSGGLEVLPVSITYSYANGATETLPYKPGGKRPEPTMPLPPVRPSAAPSASDPAAREPGPSASASTGPSASASPGPTSEPASNEERHLTAYLAGAAAMAVVGGLVLASRRGRDRRA